MPISELSQFYIMLSAFNEEFGYFMLDKRNGFKPVGIGEFARSKGVIDTAFYDTFYQPGG